MIVRTTRQDIATKHLVDVGQGRAAEVVRIDRPEKTIICFSTQVGCAIACAFCASGRDGIKANLSACQMAKLALAALEGAPAGKPVLFSAMGEGEPSQNADALARAMLALDRPGARFAASTSAPSVRLVERMLRSLDATGLTAKVQYSLHSADEAARRRLMPGALAAPRDVLALLAGRPGVELNVVLWDGVNDAGSDAHAIADLLEGVATAEPWRLKLNRGNAVQGGLAPAAPAAVAAWRAALASRGVPVEAYETDGAEIDAACGQLRHQMLKEAA